MYLRWLVSRILSQHHSRSLIHSVSEEAQWLLRMVENLLTVTRVGPSGHKLNRSLEPLATGFKDQELGLLIFTAPGSWQPEGVLVNFAAHPLASHSMGLGSHQISADFPGVLRDVLADNSCWCVFLQGAA